MLLSTYKRTIGLLSIVFALQTCAPAFAAVQETTGNFTQWLRIGSSGAPASTLAFDVTSTTKGVIFPRMTNTQKNAISSPATGTIVFSTDDNSYEFYNGSIWAPMGGIAALTANKAVATNGSGALVAATTTDTELGYLSGVTSAIQTQLGLKAPLASPTFTGVVTAPSFVGALTGNASTVTTNANLTGPVTSVGNATTITAASVTSAMLAGSIAVNKLVALGTGIIPFTDGSGFLTTTSGPVYTSATQLETTTGDTTGNVMQSTTDTTSSASVRIDQSSKSLILQTLESSTNQGYGVQINTANIAGANANPTGALSFNTGNKTAGTGSSGGMTFTTGTTVGGTRGRIAFADGSEVNSPGAVWTISGNGGGGHWVNPSDAKNYIANPDANIQSSSTTPAAWAIYADAAGLAPVDCTGGSPASTLVRNTTTPIGPTTDLLWTKSAANRQGEGFSYDFSIDKTDQGKMMAVEFDYQIASGTFVAGTQTTDSDMEVWVYDITNAALIQPYTYKLFSSTTSPPAHAPVMNFQANSNSTSYRLCVHTATTSASAYSVQFRNFEVKRQRYNFGPNGSDWAAYTPIWSSGGTPPAIGNGTLAGWWRRNGPNMQIRIEMLSGTTTTYGGANAYTFSIPSGYSIDNSLVNSTTGVGVKGLANARNTSSLTFATGAVVPGTTTSVSVAMTGGNNTFWQSTLPGTWTASAANQTIALEFEAPIVGWGSTGQMADQSPQSVVGASYATVGGVTATTLGGVIKYVTKVYDYQGTSYSTSTGLYTCPYPGLYRVTNYVNGSNTPAAGIYSYVGINGNTEYKRLVTPAQASGGFSAEATVPCNAGQTLGIYSSSATLAISDGAAFAWVTFERVAGPVGITSTETTTGTWNSTLTTSLTTGVFLQMTYATATKDSISGMNLGTGFFTAQTPGTYLACGNIFIVPSTATSALPDISLTIGSNSWFARGPSPAAGGIATVSRCAQGPMLAGQTAYMQARCTWTGGTCSLNTALTSHDFSITRLGN